MENFCIVRTEHLNAHGYLFGGQMLKWVDEYAWIAATREFPGCFLVTIGMDHVEFKQRIMNGSLLRFDIAWVEQSTTAVKYSVNVYARKTDEAAGKHVFFTNITFIRIDEEGKKSPLPPERVENSPVL
jgi:acyl-CoA hydrolase